MYIGYRQQRLQWEVKKKHIVRHIGEYVCEEEEYAPRHNDYIVVEGNRKYRREGECERERTWKLD